MSFPVGGSRLIDVVLSRIFIASFVAWEKLLRLRGAELNSTIRQLQSARAATTRIAGDRSRCKQKKVLFQQQISRNKFESRASLLGPPIGYKDN